MLQCAKHRNYKGLTPTKRDCEVCNKIYEKVQNEANQYGHFVSITTPGWKCNLEHLLSEMTCIMLYGPLPQKFWNKGNVCQKEARETFYDIFKQLKYLSGADPTYLKSTYSIFAQIFRKRYKKLILKQSASQDVVIEKNIETQKIADISNLYKTTKKLSKWDIIKKLGDQNGEEEKENNSFS